MRFELVGTPLKDESKFTPQWKQTATDDQGRRRFHGAFTGGFSAGYFNTVGSKEGWTPTNYSSSRAQRNTISSTATDYMDEEDLQAVKVIIREKLLTECYLLNQFWFSK